MDITRLIRDKKILLVVAAVLGILIIATAVWPSEDENISSGPKQITELKFAGIADVLEEDALEKAGMRVVPAAGIKWPDAIAEYPGVINFVGRLYTEVLDSVWTAKGLDEWAALLTSEEMDGGDVIEEFFESEDFLARNLSDRDYVITCYRACLERDPSEERLNYWVGRLEDGENRSFVLNQLIGTDECKAVCESYGISRGYWYSYSNAMQKKVADIAKNNKGVRDAVTGECAAWVSGVYYSAGLDYPGGNAIDYWDWWKSSGSSDMDTVPVGAAVVGSGSMSSAGMTYGHIGIYIGNGKIAHNAGGGYATISTIEEFEDDYCNGNLSTCYYSAYKGKQGILGWVWPKGEDFSG